jgi:hypothetical protein
VTFGMQIEHRRSSIYVDNGAVRESGEVDSQQDIFRRRFLCARSFESRGAGAARPFDCGPAPGARADRKASSRAVGRDEAQPTRRTGVQLGSDGSFCMTHCKKLGCKFSPWRSRLCYRHFRESRGFVFDGKQFRRKPTVPTPPAGQHEAAVGLLKNRNQRVLHTAHDATELLAHEVQNGLS